MLLFGFKQKMKKVNTIIRLIRNNYYFLYSKAIAPSEKMCAIVFFSLFFMSTAVAQFKPSKQSITKANTIVKQTFGEGVVSQSLLVNANYGSLKVDEKIVGYSCIEQASSKHDKFEFVVIYDADLNILQVKVLLYREDYGYEIKSKRWLKQFITRETREVQAISGATISVNSLKKSVELLNQKMARAIH